MFRTKDASLQLPTSLSIGTTFERTAEPHEDSAGLFRRNADHVCAAQPTGGSVNALLARYLTLTRRKAYIRAGNESLGLNCRRRVCVPRTAVGRCLLRAQTTTSSAGLAIRSGVLVSSGRFRTLALGEPSAVAPAPPSAMDHDEDRSLSLGTEVSASVPPPSPLTGCYLLAVIGEPHTHEHKEIILQRLVKGESRKPQL